MDTWALHHNGNVDNLVQELHLRILHDLLHNLNCWATVARPGCSPLWYFSFCDDREQMLAVSQDQAVVVTRAIGDRFNTLVSRDAVDQAWTL